MAKQYLDYTGLREYDARIKAWIEAHQPEIPEVDLSGIESTLQELQSLVGNESVSAQIESAMNALIDGAPQALDTLKEISNWIEEHGEAASALVESVASLGDKINQVESKIDAINAISGTMIEALFLEPVTLEENQSVQDAINNLQEGQKLVLTNNVAETLVINSDAVIEAEGVDFSGNITVDKDAAVTIIGATFSGEVVVQ